jgi:hypothetical protein
LREDNPPFPAQTVNLYLGDGIDPITDKLYQRLNVLKNKVGRDYLSTNNNTNNDISNNHDNFLLNHNKSIKLWFTEFGYDTNPCSTPLCQAVENDSIQAEWILQSFLIAIKAGYEKSFVYNLSDEVSADKGYVFGSSGLLNNNLEVKRSHQRIVWLVGVLNNKQYLGETKEGWMVFTGGLVLRVSPKVEIMKVKKGKYYLISRKMAKKLPN